MYIMKNRLIMKKVKQLKPAFSYLVTLTILKHAFVSMQSIYFDIVIDFCYFHIVNRVEIE